MKNKILMMCIASALCASFMTGCGQAPASDDAVQTNNSGIVDTLNESMGKQNALKAAKSYLDTASFSYQGLVEQLEFEKYTNEEAVYAADNCGADWKKQAEKSAKSYLNISEFSRDELIEQLESEGFTNEQAVYGVEANGY